MLYFETAIRILKAKGFSDIFQINLTPIIIVKSAPIYAKEYDDKSQLELFFLSKIAIAGVLVIPPATMLAEETREYFAITLQAI